MISAATADRVACYHTRRAAELIAKARSIVVLAGAGVSVSAGIPDFRSPGGMYETLRPELLTATAAERAAMSLDPTAVVSWSLFRDNSLPYLELRRPFILNVAEAKWKATATHHFWEALADRGALRRVFTQNIDGLDFQLNLPAEMLVHPHGTIGEAACEACGVAVESYAEFAAQVATQIRDIYATKAAAEEEPRGDVEAVASAVAADHACGEPRPEGAKSMPLPPHGGLAGPAISTPIVCSNPACAAPLVKPATVLYGRSLPPRFFELKDADLAAADLVIVAGTSLTVGPANSVALDALCPRIFLNHIMPSCFDAARGDVMLKGDCDESVIALAMAVDAVEEVEGGGSEGGGGVFDALVAAAKCGRMAVISSRLCLEAAALEQMD